MRSDILVLYYSHSGSVKALAHCIARGIDSVPGAQARIRTVPNISTVCEVTAPTIPDSGAPYVALSDLQECIGLALGSPCRFGNMASAMKYFWDSTTREWFQGTLSGKPATVFTSSSGLHYGNEVTLLTMMVPLLHHGMILTGIPPTETTLSTTQTGGSPYGATHVAGSNNDQLMDENTRRLAIAQGKRLAEIALKLYQ